MTGYKTPAQRLEAAHTRIAKLTDEVATLQKVLAAQNQATASLQREWRTLPRAAPRAGLEVTCCTVRHDQEERWLIPMYW